MMKPSRRQMVIHKVGMRMVIDLIIPHEPVKQYLTEWIRLPHNHYHLKSYFYDCNGESTCC